MPNTLTSGFKVLPPWRPVWCDSVGMLLPTSSIKWRGLDMSSCHPWKTMSLLHPSMPSFIPLSRSRPLPRELPLVFWLPFGWCRCSAIALPCFVWMHRRRSHLPMSKLSKWVPLTFSLGCHFTALYPKWSEAHGGCKWWSIRCGRVWGFRVSKGLELPVMPLAAWGASGWRTARLDEWWCRLKWRRGLISLWVLLSPCFCLVLVLRGWWWRLGGCNQYNLMEAFRGF